MDDAPARDARTVPPVGWVVALLGPVAVAGVLVPIRGEIRSANVSLVLVLVVLVAAILGGRVGGGVAAIVSAISFDFFLTRPYYSFTISSRDDLETTILLLIVGVAVGEIVVRSRRHRRVAAESRVEVGRMRRLAELAAGGEPVGQLVATVREELTSTLRLRDCRFERPPFSSVLPVLGHGRVRVPAADDDHAPDPGLVELPVWGEGRPVGRFVLELEQGTTGVLLSPEARRTAVALADQLGALIAVALDS